MCIKLKALPAQRPSAQGHDLDIPTLYTPVVSGGTMEVTDVLYPPASADETQYHILKFYDFTSNLEFSMLQVRWLNLSVFLSPYLYLAL